LLTLRYFRRGPADAERALAMAGLVLIRLKLAKMEALLGRGGELATEINPSNAQLWLLTANGARRYTSFDAVYVRVASRNIGSTIPSQEYEWDITGCHSISNLESHFAHKLKIELVTPSNGVFAITSSAAFTIATGSITSAPSATMPSAR
jgi:hypothetical protein